MVQLIDKQQRKYCVNRPTKPAADLQLCHSTLSTNFRRRCRLCSRGFMKFMFDPKGLPSKASQTCFTIVEYLHSMITERARIADGSCGVEKAIINQSTSNTYSLFARYQFCLYVVSWWWWWWTHAANSAFFRRSFRMEINFNVCFLCSFIPPTHRHHRDHKMRENVRNLRRMLAEDSWPLLFAGGRDQLARGLPHVQHLSSAAQL